MIRFAFATVALITGIASAASADLDLLYSASNIMTPVHDQLKAQFEKAHPGVNVNLEPALEYTDAMAVTLRQFLIGQAPDAGFYGIADICLLAERGIAQPLDDRLKRDPDWASLGIPKTAFKVTQCGGQTYGTPFNASFMAVIFNNELVTKAGGDPKNLPRTWPDILALAKKMDAASGGISFNYEGSSSWSFMTLVQSQGGKILTDDGKDIAFDTPAGLKALQLLADIGAARGHADMTKAQARQAFSGGTLGILVDSTSGLVNYKKAAAGKFGLGVVPFPTTKNGTLPVSGMAGVLLTGDKEKGDLAWDYIKSASSPEGQTLIGKLTGFLPFNQVAIETADKLGAYYAENPELLVASESIKVAGIWPSFPGPNGLKIHATVLGYMQQVYTGAIEPKTALEELAAETRALLK